MNRSAPAPTAARDAACTCSRLRRATRAITQLYDDAMAGTGLRVTQFSLLRNLARAGPVRVTALAGLLLLERTALSRTLDPLVDAGYVEVKRGRDARTREVSITRAGREALASALGPWKRAQAEVARRVGAAKLEGLNATLVELEALHPGAAERHASKDDVA
jgi:DNA-binding MarR family transcriptional regulator